LMDAVKCAAIVISKCLGRILWIVLIEQAYKLFDKLEFDKGAKLYEEIVNFDFSINLSIGNKWL
jgi:hypothetical protein